MIGAGKASDQSLVQWRSGEYDIILLRDPSVRCHQSIYAYILWACFGFMSIPYPRSGLAIRRRLHVHGVVVLSYSFMYLGGM